MIMPYHLAYHVIFWLLVGIILSACGPSPEVITTERINLARMEDQLAECRLFVLEKDFEKNSATCKTFLEQNDYCAEFPDQKGGCQQFLYGPYYRTHKLQCTQLHRQETICQNLVQTEIEPWFYKWLRFFDLADDEQHWTHQLKRKIPNIHIGIVRSGHGMGTFLEGIELAVEEINENGGILGRQLQTHIEFTGGILERSREIAAQMRDDKRIRAVFGRQPSRNVIPVTYVYEDANIVFFAISASNMNVIRGNMQFVFRQLPNNDAYARALVGYCKQQNYHNIALLYSRDSYSEEISSAFRDYAIKAGMKITFEKSFFDTQADFLQIAANLRQSKPQPDVIFSPTGAILGAHLITDLRTMGIMTPIVGSDSLDSSAFLDLISDKENALVIPTIYNPFSEQSQNVKFVNAFKKKYGRLPEPWSVQGYDAIKLFAYVVENESHSTVPANIAASLTHMPPWQGAAAVYAYEESGEVKNRPIYFKELQNKEFILLKNTQQEEELLYFDIIEDRIIYRHEKRGESTEAMSIL